MSGSVYLVTRGSTSWRVAPAEDAKSDEVAFSGEMQADMVWDAGLDNIRAMSAQELSAKQQAKAIADLKDAVQVHLDSAAQAHDYNNILSAASYAGSTHPKFGPEGVAFRDWRDACWSYVYAVYEQVLGGQRALPSASELIAELPALGLP